MKMALHLLFPTKKNMNENGIAPPLTNQEKWTASNLKI
jgi:hypothetical protein